MYINCPHTKKIVKKELGIPEEDFEIDDIIADKEYPFNTEIHYRLINKDGEEVYIKKNVMGMVYDELLNHWLKCRYVNQKTKKMLKREKEEFDKAWDEYIRDP